MDRHSRTGGRRTATIREPLCHSERLSSKQNCLNTVNVIKREAASAKIYNNTGEPM